MSDSEVVALDHQKDGEVHDVELRDEKELDEIVPLVNQDNIDKNKRTTVKLGSRQLTAVLAKNWKLKMRRKKQTCCEVISPILFMFILVFGYWLSIADITYTPARIYVNDTSVISQITEQFLGIDTLDLSGFNISNVNQTQFNTTGITAANANDRILDIINGLLDNPLPSDLTTINATQLLPLIPILAENGILFNNGTGGLAGLAGGANGEVNQEAIGALNSVLNYPGPFPVIPFEQFIQVHELFTQLFLANSTTGDFVEQVSIADNRFGNLLKLGKLSFVPDTPQVKELRDWLNQTYPNFNNYYLRTYDTEEKAVNDAIESDQTGNEEERTWAIVVFNKLDVLGGDVDFTIRMNYSVLPSTKRLRNRFRLGLDNTFLRYYFSGYLSVQHAIDSYVLNRTGVPSNTTSLWNDAGFIGAPFPTKAIDENLFYTATGAVVGLLMTMSLLYPVSRLIKGVVEEKELKLKETMKMMGLKDWVFNASWFLTYFVMFTFTSAICTLMLGGTLLPTTNNIVLFLYFWLFMLSQITFGAFISVFFDRAKLAGIIGPVIMFVCLMPRYIFFGTEVDEDVTGKLFASFFPQTAFAFGGDKLMEFEGGKQGINWDNLWDDEFSFGAILLVLAFDFVFYGLLAWYFENILKNEYGSNKPWYFLCTKKYWENDEVELVQDEEWENVEKVSKSIEGVSDELKAKSTIKIKNLVKHFEVGGRKDRRIVKAVKGVDLQIYRDNILCLLGHNGAGKSTLLSCITGLINPTEGDCIIAGNSILTDMKKIRHSMGVCPQHNVLFDTLTVHEHLILFATLKGLEGKYVEECVKEIVHEVGLEDKMHVYSSALSGGMKRKLSVAIALIGGSEIVFLDEPTSGMDPQARRHTWELLQKNKKGRTIILTTHFMDEADILGDRIAIMSNGKIRCAGTTLFLKSIFGVGYCLTMVKENEDCESEKVFKMVSKYVKKCKVLSSSGGEMSYLLPLGASDKFEALFKTLEESRKELSIGGYGISMTTLEEVFLRLAAEENVDEASDKKGEASDKKEDTEDEKDLEDDDKEKDLEDDKEKDLDEDDIEVQMKQEYKTATLWVQQKELFKKRYTCSIRDFKGRFFEVILPVIMVILVLLILTITINPAGPSLLMTPALYNTSDALMPGQKQEILMGRTDAMPNIFPKNITDYINSTEEHLSYYTLDNSTTGVEMSEILLDGYNKHTNRRTGAYVWNLTIPVDVTVFGSPQVLNLNSPVTVLHNTTSFHSLPIYVSQIQQARYRYNLGNPNAKYVTRVHPLPLTPSGSLRFRTFLSLFAALFVLIPFCYLPASFVIFVVKERYVKAKHLQLVSGVNPIIYWTSTFAWDLVNYCFIIFCVMWVFVAYGSDEFVGDAESAFATLFLFLFYGLAAIPFAYILSFWFVNHSSAQVGISAVNFVVGFILVIASFILDSTPSTSNTNSHLKHIYRCFPGFNLGESLINLSGRYLILFYTGETTGAFDWDILGRSLVYLTCECVVFCFIVIGIELKWFNKAWKKIKGKCCKRSAKVDEEKLEEEKLDADVEAEKQRVLSGDADDDLLCIKGLTKIYAPRGNLQKPTIAVRDMNLGIARNQCFGFLGINGAGKTTTMSILTGESEPTYGSATIRGFDVQTQLENVRQELGYCPQFDPLIDLLNSYETLQMYGRLKGMSHEEAKSEAKRLVKKVGLENFASKVCGSYSGGNKRKLSLAIALIGSPSCIFLDEPSTGMDPASRRAIWDVIQSITKNRSIILTTHSMEECEALCNRVCIMVSGKLQVIGSVQHLKSKFGQGYQMEISGGSIQDELKIQNFVSDTFKGAKLVERHNGHIKYSLPQQDLSLSKIFGSIEASKKECGIINYSVSQSTLEQIFVNIAKEQERINDKRDQAMK